MSHEGIKADIAAAHKSGTAYPKTATPGRHGGKKRPFSGLYRIVHQY
jgi:hypothetical protein